MLVQAERGFGSEIEFSENPGNRLRSVNGPVAAPRALRDRPFPESESSLFSRVDFLAASHQPDDHGPSGNPLGELDEIFRLRPRLVHPYLVRVRGPSPVVGALRFVEDDHVFGRNGPAVSTVAPDVFLYRSNERLAAASRAFQHVAENLHERAVAREKHGRSPAFARPRFARNRGVRDSKTDESLSRPGNSGQQHQSSGQGPSGFRRDFLYRFDGGVGVRGRSPQPGRTLGEKQPPRGVYESRKGPVGFGGEKAPGAHGLHVPPGRKLRDESVEFLDPADPHVALGQRAASRHPGRHQYRMNGPFVTVPVIAHQVSRVGVGLVYVSVGRIGLSLELDHDHVVV